MKTTIAMLILLTAAGAAQGALIADHECIAQFGDIPLTTFAAIREWDPIFYGHTSHGSQLVTGMIMIEQALGIEYLHPELYEVSDDLGTAGDVGWVEPTRNYLDAHPGCRLVIWSWCGGMSTNYDADVDVYLNAMTQLENDYPSVVFVYMTGHLDGTGVDGNLMLGNQRIRDYCVANGKVLFDFADIEAWDPDGVFHPDETDGCGWCDVWCAAHPGECIDCGYCAHTHCYNCWRKGQAFWWLLARSTGWTSTPEEATSFGSVKGMFR